MKRRWHYVYLARGNDGSYYCGYALDPRARVAMHNSGKGSKALRSRTPAVLAYTKRFAEKGPALRFEAELKRCGHEHKEKLSRHWLRIQRAAGSAS